MTPSRPRSPRTTIAAFAVIVAMSAALAGLMRVAQTSTPSTITMVDPQAPGGVFNPPHPPPGGSSASTAADPGSWPWSLPSSARPSGGGTNRPSAAPSRTTSVPAPSRGAGPSGSPSTAAPTGPGTGSLIWNGKPAGGQSQFAVLDCAKPGSLTIENDLRFGPVWVFAKPAGDDRCEAHGIAPGKSEYDFSNNSTYYIGWWSKVSSVADNADAFQWMSYGAGTTQGYPFVINSHNGHATLLQRQPGSSGQTVWASPSALTANTWHHYVVGIHTSNALTGGWIELWYDGKLQTFANGSTQYACRTWDVNDEPKWGEYGTQSSAVTDYVYAPKVGTSYASVAG